MNRYETKTPMQEMLEDLYINRFKKEIIMNDLINELYELRHEMIMQSKIYRYNLIMNEKNINFYHSIFYKGEYIFQDHFIVPTFHHEKAVHRIKNSIKRIRNEYLSEKCYA